MRSFVKARPYPVFVRSLAFVIALTCLVPMAGCRICCDVDDENYAAYGGSWQRTRRDGGRVGSIFDPAGAKASVLVNRDDPDKPDALERRRRKDDPAGAPMSPDEDLDPKKPDEDDTVDPQEKLRQQREKLREQGLEDIKIVPGIQVPPAVY